MHAYPDKGAELPFVWAIEKYHIGLASDILLTISSHAISEGLAPLSTVGLGGGLALT